MANHEYDDEIFTLKEDEIGKRRGHILQYALVSLFAVAVIAAALVGSFWLTENRLAYQKIQTGQEALETETPADDTNYWPEEQFPGIPKLQSSVYDTRLSGQRAEINVPMAAASGFERYANQLADDGAQIYVKIDRLMVLNYKGTEVHLISGSGKNAVVLCAESRTAWSEAGYADFLLPKAGVLVDVSEGTGEGSRVLTYRQASASDAIGYCSDLVSAGWIITGTLEPQDHIFACPFKKGDMQISVDYFSGSDNFRVRLDFISQAAPETA